MSNKAKTNKTTWKRFKKTGKGKYISKQGGIKHINTKMSRKKIRRLGKSKVVNSGVNARRLKKLLPCNS